MSKSSSYQIRLTPLLQKMEYLGWRIVGELREITFYVDIACTIKLNAKNKGRTVRLMLFVYCS